MKSSNNYFRIKLLQQFLNATDRARQQLTASLIDHATDPVIVMRRFRMIKQLAEYEAQIVTKIQNFDTDDVLDFDPVILNEIKFITNYSS